MEDLIKKEDAIEAIEVVDWYHEYEWYDFCPHCGARMKGADDETD